MDYGVEKQGRLCTSRNGRVADMSAASAVVSRLPCLPPAPLASSCWGRATAARIHPGAAHPFHVVALQACKCTRHVAIDVAVPNVAKIRKGDP